MNYYPITPSESSDETEQAKRILIWLDTRFRHTLNDENARIYQKCRTVFGQPSSTTHGKLAFGSPSIQIQNSPVSGTGDNAYGHNRVIAIVQDLIIPMIEKGELDDETIFAIRNMCRGNFANQYHLIERAKAIHQSKQQ